MVNLDCEENNDENVKRKRRIRMKLKLYAKKMMVVMSCVAMMGAMLTGCGKSDAKKETSEASESKQQSGTITMVGSTSMEKLALALAEDYMNKNKDVQVTAEFVGSGAGIEAVINGTTDIGNSSRALKDEEKTKGVVENIVAMDGIAVIVNQANTVTNLTKDQLVSIYTGTIKNWSEVGGKDTPIVVIGREAGSGTRGAFEEILKIADTCVYANELENTGAVMAQVSATEGAVGYVSLDVVDDTVKALDFDGVSANEDTIRNNTYTLSRPFVMATKGEISEQSELVQAFFKYLQSEEGRAIITQVGLVTVD